MTNKQLNAQYLALHDHLETQQRLGERRIAQLKLSTRNVICPLFELKRKLAKESALGGLFQQLQNDVARAASKQYDVVLQQEQSVEERQLLISSFAELVHFLNYEATE